jgi:hypothetical protein
MQHHIIRFLAVLALDAMLLAGCYFFQQSVIFTPLCAFINSKTTRNVQQLKNNQQ